MNIITKSVLVASCAALLVSVQANAQGVNKPVRSISDTSLDCYFAPCSGEFATPDAEGFIRRWSLLEPIDKKEPMTDEQKNAAGFRRGNVFPNTLFTDSYLRDHFGREYFKDQLTIVPKDGQKVKVGKKNLLGTASTVSFTTSSCSVLPATSRQTFTEFFSGLLPWLTATRTLRM